MAGNPYLEALDAAETPRAANDNPYLRALDAHEREASGRLGFSLEIAEDTNPDEAARVERVAAGLSLHPDLVAPDVDEAERELRRRTLNPDKLRADNPYTAALLADPSFAAVAHDDTDTLTAFETIAQPQNTRGRGAVGGGPTPLSELNAWRYDVKDRLLAQPFERGRATNQLGALYYAQMDGEANPTREAEIARLEALTKQQVTIGDGVLSWALANNAELAGQMIDPLMAGAKTGAAVGMGAGATAALAGPGAAITTPAATAGGFAAGMATELLANTFRVETGHAYKEFRDMKALDGAALDPAVAKGAALAVGTANTLLEAGGLSALAKVFGVDPKSIAARFSSDAVKKQILQSPTFRTALASFGKRIGQGVGIETVQEVAQELVTILAGEAAQSIDGRAFEPTDGAVVLDRLGTIAAKTATGAIGLSAVGAAPRFIVDSQRAQRAEENKQLFDALAQNAQGSKLGQRLPGRLQEAYDRIAKGGPLESVYVDANALVTLFQGDVGAAVDALPSTKDTLASAIAGNDFVAIPVGEFATKLAGTDQYRALVDDIKLRPDDFSPREAEAWRTNYQADFERELQQAELDAVSAAIAQAPADRVQSSVVQMLRNAGVANHIATQQGALWRAFFATMGQRAGVDPEALFQRYQVRIQGEAQRLAQVAPADELDLLINRARNGREANAREMFGPSFLEWIAEQGGLQDQGGELSARDLQLFHKGKPFQKRLVNENGMTFETLAERAVQAGYLTEQDIEEGASAENVVLEAVSREAGGDPIYVPKNRNEALASRMAEAEDLRQFLEGQGVDLAAADNAEIRELLRGAASGQGPAAGSQTLEQSPVDEWPTHWPQTLPEGDPLLTPTIDLPGREALREEQIQRILAAAKPVEGRKPIAWVMGGGGGSGKGTVLKALIANGEIPGTGKAPSVLHIDPDDVKERIPEFGKFKEAGDSRGAAMVHAESSLIAGEATTRALALKTDIVLDRTLSRQAEGLAEIQALRDAGYEIRLIGVSLDTAEALRRAEKRAQHSWRYVPPRLLIAAHQGFAAAWDAYAAAVDSARLFDNNEAAPRQVLRTEGGGAFEVSDAAAYNRFRDKAQEVIQSEQSAAADNLGVPELRSGEALGGGEGGGYRGSGGIQPTRELTGIRTGNDAVAPGPQRDDPLGSVRSDPSQGSGGQPDGVTLEQQGARGSITLPPSPGDGPTIINLFQSSDLSTFFHESGHFFLEVMRDLASDPAGSVQLRGDYETILAWLGAPPNTPPTVEQHEKFARGFESYLFEGKSPNPDLDSIFARFRSWLIAVYKTLAALNVRINDDVREVFDRMLASDEQISLAQQRIADRPALDDPAAVGLNEIDVAAYQTLAKKYHDDAVRGLEAKALRELRETLTAQYKAQREVVRKEVEAEVNQRRVYQVLHVLQTGTALVGEMPEGFKPIKLDRKDIAENFGTDTLDRLPGRGRTSMTRAKGGVPVATAAEFFGYASGDALILDLINTRPREQEVRLETDRRMQLLHGDILKDGRAEEAATEALHNDARGLLLAMEALALSKRNVSSHPAVLKAIKAYAAEQIARLPIARATKPFPYLLAERRAARDAERALIARDFPNAARHKRAQLLNHALAQEAYRVSAEVDRALKYFKRFDSLPKTLAPDYWTQIAGLLGQYDLRRAVTQKELAKRKSLTEFLATQLANGTITEAQIAIPPKVIANARRQHYTQLTAEDFAGLTDAVKNLAHLGVLKQKLLKAQDTREFDQLVNDLVTSAQAHRDYKDVPLPYGRGPFDPVREAATTFNAHHVKPEFAFEHMDSGKAGGAWWTALFKPIADAESAELAMMHDATKRYMRLINLYSRKERALWHRQRRRFAGLQVSLAKDELLALALNWGNDINRQRILSGHQRYGWTEAAVMEALDTLDARDWDFVQGTWDLINSFWPQLVAHQTRLTGLPPAKVEATPVMTRFGQMSGGYYPLKYDTRLSERAHRLDEKQGVKEQFGDNWARAQTRQGHLEARKENVTQPVLLDLSVAAQHIENVIHDLTHREAVIDVDRLLQDDDVSAAIKGVMGIEFYRTLRPWLKGIAGDRTPAPNMLNTVLRHARHGMTVVSMGLKFTTALVQPLGFTQSLELLGERAALTGLKAFYGQPWQIEKRIEFVTQRSAMMRHRMTTFDRDVRDIEKQFGARSALREVDAVMFAGIGLMDMAVSLPTWLGAYDKGMTDFKNDEAKAIAFADRSVRLSQGSGSAKDLAAIQRGDDTHRIFTMFYSYFSTLNNLLRRRTQATRGVGDAGRAALALLYLVAVPAVLGELVLGRGPDDEDDWLTWAVVKIGAYPFMSMVGIRDIVSAATSDYGYSLTPVADAFQFVADTARKVGEGDFDRSALKSGVNALGVWLKLPSRQAWLSGEYLVDYFSGDIEDFSVYEFLVTGHKK